MQQRSHLLLKAVRALAGALAAAALLPAQPTKSPAEIYRSVGDAVVLIQGATKSGSGVVIASDDMMIVTNFHVIAGEKSVTVKFADGRVLTTDELWGSDQQRDLAFLAVTGHTSGRADLAEHDDVAPGDPVVVVSNPLGLERSVSSGLVSGIRVIDNRKSLQISAPISPGSSGGPVFNARGQVVGIATATMIDGQNLNLAIPVSEIWSVIRTIDVLGIMTGAKRRQKLTELPPAASASASETSGYQIPSKWFSASTEEILADPAFEAIYFPDRAKILAEIDPKFAHMSEKDQHLYIWHAETKYLPRGSATRLTTWARGGAGSTTDFVKAGCVSNCIRKTVTEDGISVGATLERSGFSVAHIWVTNGSGSSVAVDPRTWVLNVARPKSSTLYYQYPERVGYEVEMAFLSSPSHQNGEINFMLDHIHDYENRALHAGPLQPGHSVDGDVYFQLNPKVGSVTLRVFINNRAFDIPFSLE